MPADTERSDLLQRTFLFRGLEDQKALEHVAAAMEEVFFPANHVIFQEGEKGDRLYIVVSGRVRSKVRGLDLAYSEPGAYFGEMSFFGGKSRSATSIALEPTTCLALKHDDLNTAIQDSPKIAMNLMHVLSTRLRQINRMLVESDYIPPLHDVPEVRISEDPQDLLRNIPIFRDINDDRCLQQLSWITREETFAPGEPIFSKGDSGDRLYIVLSGRVKIHIGDKELARLGPGTHFGEMSLFDSEPRSASVTPLEECRCLTLSQQQIYGASKKAPAIATNMVETLCDRVRNMIGELAQLYEESSRDEREKQTGSSYEIDRSPT